MNSQGLRLERQTRRWIVEQLLHNRQTHQGFCLTRKISGAQVRD